MPFLITKKIGETPLEALERARIRRNIPATVPLAYAGRLDPMASGKLLILEGEECKEQARYHGLDKEYVVEVLLGIGSDTGDILGLITESDPVFPSGEDIKKVITSFVGPYRTPYPAFSSKTVEGKPLFQWTLEGKEIERPLQNGTIHSLRFLGKRTISRTSLLKYVEKKVATLTPVIEESKALGRDFRKVEALASWQTIRHERFYILKIRVKTSAGVYMRTLASDIAKGLTADGIALSITRTAIFYKRPSLALPQS